MGLKMKSQKGRIWAATLAVGAAVLLVSQPSMATTLGAIAANVEKDSPF